MSDIHPEDENNALLARHAASDAAVQVVMDQLGLRNPTLLSTWTKLEVARLLHALHAEPGGEIVLGEQTLSGGFKQSTDFTEMKKDWAKSNGGGTNGSELKKLGHIRDQEDRT